ncbi:MAG TPA: GNAT family N-acetyltransferase [Flavobacterium sp.]|nr:GNAT family N-acetyltransferase [Flavobacterium sp.]
MEYTIRIGQISDLSEIQKLFSDSITFVCSKDYSQIQIDAWKTAALKLERWQMIVENQFFIVAEFDNKIVGFASLENGNYIDVLYVHKDYQRQGIAQRLFDTILKEANRLNSLFITADVSITAKPFFESNGFLVVKEQIQQRNNVDIVNFKMQKTVKS